MFGKWAACTERAAQGKDFELIQMIKMLGLETLERRRLIYDLVLYYKILHGHFDMVLSFVPVSIVSHVAIIF